MKNKKTKLITSSAAEYLTYIASNGEDGIEVKYYKESIWATQKMLATIYGVKPNTINEHIKKIYADKELSEIATIRNFRIVQKEGSRDVERTIIHYSLPMIISVGFKVNNQRAVQFRKWINMIAHDYTIKGFVMDDERFKQGHKFTDKFFEEQLIRIREIRASERKFYQKITDLYSTSIDYDPDSKITIEFFKKVQNKLHYAAHRHTAAEIIYNRADSKKDNMGLTTWKDAPDGKIQKFDVTVAKNYLSEKELDFLNRLVVMYLDYAEIQAENKIPMTMEDWSTRLDSFIEFNGKNILTGSGKISNEKAKLHAKTEFEKYRVIQDKQHQNDFDKFLNKVPTQITKDDTINT